MIDKEIVGICFWLKFAAVLVFISGLIGLMCGIISLILGTASIDK